MYNIMTSLAYRSDDPGEVDRKARLSMLSMAIFSCGQSWTANSGSIILKSQFGIETILDKILPFIKDGDFAVIIDQVSGEAVSVGFIADEEGFDQLVPGAKKIGISPSGMTYPIN